VCGITNDSVDDEIETVCRLPRAGSTTEVGGDCTDANTCESGVCLNVRDNEGNVVSRFCSTPCVVAADCSGGLTQCGNANFNTPSGNGTQAISVCLQ